MSYQPPGQQPQQPYGQPQQPYGQPQQAPFGQPQQPPYGHVPPFGRPTPLGRAAVATRAAVAAAIVVVLFGVLIGNSFVTDLLFHALQSVGLFRPEMMHAVSVLTFPWLNLMVWALILGGIALLVAALVTALVARLWLSRTTGGVFPIVWLSTIIGAVLGGIVRLIGGFVYAATVSEENIELVAAMITVAYTIGWGLLVGLIAGGIAQIAASSASTPGPIGPGGPGVPGAPGGPGGPQNPYGAPPQGPGAPPPPPPGFTAH